MTGLPPGQEQLPSLRNDKRSTMITNSVPSYEPIQQEFTVPPQGCSVIINRLSGSYSEEKVEQVKAFLEKNGFSPHIFLLQDFTEVMRVTRQICAEQQNPLIIIGGGDGTINGVLNGMSPGSATMAVLPFGTSNVLTRELAIYSMEDALQRIVRGTSRPTSVGMIEHDSVRKYFLLMAGVGFDGAVVQGVRFREKRMLGKAAYVLSALRQLLNWEKVRLAISAGNRSFECHSIIVCNSAKYAGEFKIAPGASLFDSEFEVVCIQKGTRYTYLKATANMLRGKGMSGPDICSFRSRELTISGAKPVQVDGDYYCHSPVKISIVPEYVKLIV
jgi:diacylglycerol kinase (ATP)